MYSRMVQTGLRLLPLAFSVQLSVGSEKHPGQHQRPERRHPHRCRNQLERVEASRHSNLQRTGQMKRYKPYLYMRGIFSLLVAALSLGLAMAGAPPELPATPAGKVLAGYLEALNSGN